MANINLSRAYKTASFDGFGGIDRARTGKGGVGVADLKNFRVEADGKLSKRCGFAPLSELPEGKLRAIHAFSDTLVFALIDSSLYELDLTLATCTLKATLSESDTDACFFNYGNTLYLIDGIELYAYDGADFNLARGYVPLYGKDWDHIRQGEIHQPINALSDRVRIRYKISSSSTLILTLPFAIRSLDLALLNGHMILPEYFEFDPSASLIHLKTDFKAGDALEIFYTPDDENFTELRKQATAHTRAVSFGFGSKGGDPSFLALYGGSDGTRMCVSRHIEEEDLALVSQAYSDTLPIYFANDDTVTVNDGAGDITAACRSGQYLAVFTESSGYIMTESDGGLPKLAPISLTSGCSVKDGATTFENSPVTISKNGILYWSPSTLYDNAYTASCISAPISELMTSDEKTGCAVYYSNKNELWFYRSGEERVWIYHTMLKCWYSFDGFAPLKMLEIGGNMAFVSGSTLYGFSDELSSDTDSEGEKPIVATLQSSLINFGTINRRKRLARVMLSLSPDAEVTLTVKDAHGNETISHLSDKSGERLGYCESRLPCKRSRFYSFSLSHNGGALSIYSLTFTAVE